MTLLVIIYLQVSTTVHRGSRLRNGIQLRDRSGTASGNHNGSVGVNGRRSRSTVQTDAPKPQGRQSRTSRAAEGAAEGMTRSPPRRGRVGGRANPRRAGGSRDLSPGSWEEDDDDDDDDHQDEGDDHEDEDDAEEQDWGTGRAGRGRGRGKASSTGRLRRTRDVDDSEEEELDENDDIGRQGRGGATDSHKRQRNSVVSKSGGGDAAHGSKAEVMTTGTWGCPICTADNALANEKCEVCDARRPAAAMPRGARKRQRQPPPAPPPRDDTDDLDGGGGSSSSSSSPEDDDAGVDSDGASGISSATSPRGSRSGGHNGRSSNSNSSRARGRGRGRVSGGGSGGEAPRRRRQVARVNYAEVNEEDDDGGGGGKADGDGQAGAGSTPRASAASWETGRNESRGTGRPLRLKEEMRRAGKEEDGLPDEVRAFRNRVREVIKGFAGETFAVHFREPVDLTVYPQYVDIVAEPMDLSTILFKLRAGEYDSPEVRTLTPIFCDALVVWSA